MTGHDWGAGKSLFERIEWAASALNEDCEHIARCCPDCEGINPEDWDYVGEERIIGKTRGHKPGCELARLIAEGK